jgi:RluA family pseudouridine synthase
VPIAKLKLTTTREHATKRLDEILVDWLSNALERPVSRAKARKLIIAGAVRLNGRQVRIASQNVFSGASIEAGVDVAKLFGDSTSRDKPFELTDDRILFEDADLLVVDKPSGLPSQPTLDAGRDNLFAAVRRFLARREGTSQPYVGVHQRLDRDTSGVVLFTKSKRVNAAVADIFSNHVGIKVYHAITARSRDKLDREWTIKNYLGPVSSRSKRTRYGAVGSDGDYAETSFRVIAEHRRGIWIEAIPKTGRTHQIRVHLSEYGLPILGDDLYGASDAAPRLMLHAVELTFPHPITRREISVRSAVPADFEQCLRRITTPSKPQ